MSSSSSSPGKRKEEEEAGAAIHLSAAVCHPSFLLLLVLFLLLKSNSIEMYSKAECKTYNSFGKKRKKKLGQLDMDTQKGHRGEYEQWKNSHYNLLLSIT